MKSTYIYSYGICLAINSSVQQNYLKTKHRHIKFYDFVSIMKIELLQLVLAIRKGGRRDKQTKDRRGGKAIMHKYYRPTKVFLN